MMAASGLASLQAPLSSSLTHLPAHRQPPRLCLVYCKARTLHVQLACYSHSYIPFRRGLEDTCNTQVHPFHFGRAVTQ